MSFASACESWEAHERAEVMFQTWGHLYPRLGSRHTGFIEFARGTYSACELQPLRIEFPTLPDSPVLYEDVDDFLFARYANPWKHEGEYDLPSGIYRWEGTYRKCKNTAGKFENGNLYLVYSMGDDTALPLLNRRRPVSNSRNGALPRSEAARRAYDTLVHGEPKLSTA